MCNVSHSLCRKQDNEDLPGYLILLQVSTKRNQSFYFLYNASVVIIISIISIIIVSIISTDEDPSLRIESSAIINLRGVSTKLNKYIVFTMQTYKKLNASVVGTFLHICLLFSYTVN